MKKFLRNILHASAATTIALTMTVPAQAQTVSMSGLVINLCVLSLTTPGTLVSAPTGITLSTAEIGGIPALLTVVAAGTNPTITFSAPTVVGPSASTSTVEFAYSSLGGANRPFTSTGYVAPLAQLLDAITINGRVTNANGFGAGTYTVSATATCAQ
jgi:hypothetical protein